MGRASNRQARRQPLLLDVARTVGAEILEYPFAPSDAQGVMLKMEILIIGRDARVAEEHGPLFFGQQTRSAAR
jgi:hypothetical protein